LVQDADFARSVVMHSERRFRPIYVLAVSNAVSTMGYGLYAYIFPSFLTSLGATPPQVGLVSTLMIVAMAVTLVPGGILSDRGHRKKLLIASWLLPIFAPLFFILAYLGSNWLYALPGVIMFGGSWIGIAAVQSYTSEAAPAGKRGLSFAILLSSSSIGLIASPLIGGVVIEDYGFIVLFLIAFILYAVSTVAVATVPRLPGDSVKPRVNAGEDTLVEGNRKEITTQTISNGKLMNSESGLRDEPSVLRRLTPMLALNCLFMGILYLSWGYIPLYLKQRYGLDYYNVQVMYAIANASSFFVINVIGKLSDRFSPANRLTLTAIPIGAVFLGYWILLNATGLLFLSGGFILMGTVGTISSLMYSIVGELSAGKEVGLTYGVIGTLIYVAEAATPYLGGVIYAYSGQLPFILTLALSPFVLVVVYVAHLKTK
jgi:MFS family permease